MNFTVLPKQLILTKHLHTQPICGPTLEARLVQEVLQQWRPLFWDWWHWVVNNVVHHYKLQTPKNNPMSGLHNVKKVRSLGMTDLTCHRGYPHMEAC